MEVLKPRCRTWDKVQVQQQQLEVPDKEDKEDMEVLVDKGRIKELAAAAKAAGGAGQMIWWSWEAKVQDEALGWTGAAAAAAGGAGAGQRRKRIR
ncbi:hypothetical protein TNIN_381151 [Trichonephila inaurata madagascariensis]|uniref:Uncharacterized protein n=1 Tax=Trichonephila inaurata madagascariensis TaxID=2747483 RepID=A0A8X6JXM5_9ARAC|nr:hypothetical protein TNIN_381151 [Trichonephila inaurata madagascariensis]